MKQQNLHYDTPHISYGWLNSQEEQTKDVETLLLQSLMKPQQSRDSYFIMNVGYRRSRVITTFTLNMNLQPLQITLYYFKPNDQLITMLGNNYYLLDINRIQLAVAPLIILLHMASKNNNVRMRKDNSSYISLQKTKPQSQRPKKKKYHEQYIQVPEAIAYLLLQEKASLMEPRHRDLLPNKEHRSLKTPSKDSENIQLNPQLNTNLAQDYSKIQYLNNAFKRQKLSLPFGSQTLLQINTMSEPDHRYKGKRSIQQIQLLQKSRYRKKLLEPINVTKPSMSNNIKDYLSVEKKPIKEIEQSLLANKIKILKKYHQTNIFTENLQRKTKELPRYQQRNEGLPIKPKTQNFQANKSHKFKPPFDLYYYRDFMWKVAFSNQFLVQPPEDYQHKVKYFVGPGNNSNLIKGIMGRRPWFQLTEKIQDAHFIWTQIKISSVFQTQLNNSQKSTSILDNFVNIHTQQSNFTLFNQFEKHQWSKYWNKNMERQKKLKNNLSIRAKIFNLDQNTFSQVKNKIKIHNHFCNSYIIGNKKALFQTMSQYYNYNGLQVFDFLPLTFHIKNGIQDDQYLKFLQHFYTIAKNNKSNPSTLNKFNAWIIKPGQNTNRGNGIIVCLNLNQIKSILKRKEKHQDGTYKTYILQKYIQKPLLYMKRKFDLRHYIMLNCSNGKVKGYWYQHGYVRTTSSQYTLQISSGSIHLTNDAVQKYLPDYGKYQKGNKITYEQLNSFIKKSDPAFDFFKQIFPKMKEIATNAMHASALNMDPQRRMNNFQIFGLDFMIDADYNVWLIEINTNPCLQTGCPVLDKIIPKFIQNTFQICIDPVFPAPLNFEPKFNEYYKNIGEQNNFELVFDQRIDKAQMIGDNLLMNQPNEENDVFDDDGQNFQG